jgi:outer membrane protein TolC
MNNLLSFQNRLLINFRWCIAFLLLLALAVPAGAQRSLTLSQAINHAFQNRKNIQAGRSDQVIRKLQTDALYRKYWPQVSAEYTYQYNPILQTSILPIGVFNPSYPPGATEAIQFGTKWSQSAGLTLNQPLIDLSVNRQINEAKLQERIVAAAQAQTEYDLAYTVAQAYIDINVQETKVRSAIADTSRTWVSYQLLQDKFDQKRLLRSELNKGKINHNNALQQYQKAVSQLIEDKVYLLFLIGRKDIDNADIVLDTSFMATPLLAVATHQATATSIPELQQLELNSEVSAKQIRTERAKYLPTLSLKGYLGANQYTNNLDPTAPNSWFGLSYVGIDLKYPLLFGEDKKKKIQQLQLQASQYEQQKEDKAAQYDKDAITAKIRMERILAELRLQEENILLSKQSVTIFQYRVSEGQESASSLNLEEADLQKLDADYQGNRKQYWLYYLDFLRATGKLDMLWAQ